MRSETLKDVKATEPTPTVCGPVTFQGTFAPITFDAEDKSILFLGAKNTLYYPESGARINAFRSYFTLDLDGSNVKSFSLNFDEESTGVGSLSPALTPVSNGSWYDLSGRIISLTPNPSPISEGSRKQLPRGIYIHNGKKVVIK